MMYTDDQSIVSDLLEETNTTSTSTFETSDFDSLQFAKARLQSWLNHIQAAHDQNQNNALRRVTFPVIQEPIVSPKIQLSGSAWTAFELYARRFGVVTGRRQATLHERLHAGVTFYQTCTIVWVQLNMPPDEAVEHHYYKEQQKRRERPSIIDTRRKRMSESSLSTSSTLSTTTSSSSSFSRSPQPKLDMTSQRRMDMIRKNKARIEKLRRQR